MGHFTIDLPNNQQGNIRWGTIKNKSSLLNVFKSKKSDEDINKSYIVNIEPTPNEHKEYHLLKTKDGKWTSESYGGFQLTPDDEISTLIKSAIDNYESQH